MPGQDYLDRFWQSANELPQFRDHPLAPERSLSRLVPLSIHGDETPVLSKEKIWSSSALIFLVDFPTRQHFWVVHQSKPTLHMGGLAQILQQAHE